MRKVDNGKKEKKEKKKKKKRMTFLVATTSLPAVERPNADRWNVPRSCQKLPLFHNFHIEQLLKEYNKIYEMEIYNNAVTIRSIQVSNKHFIIV